MKPLPPAPSSRICGTVTLVALCFTAVMGITLAGYIAVCSRAMNLSNRTFQNNLSKQLAEVGIDEALRAFNKNDWSDWSSSGTAADWTVSGTTATCNLTFPAGKFGQGVTGSVKIRVDNYNANQLNSTWSSSVTYRIGDLVGYNGIWYRSLRNNNTNQTPSATNPIWWAPNPMPWTWSRNNNPAASSSDTSYALYDLVNYNGTWYRCVTAVASGTTASAPALAQKWTSTTTYSLSDVVSHSNALYRCVVSSSTNSAPPSADWSSTIYWLPILAAQPWDSLTPYSLNDVVNYNGLQYRCNNPHTSSATFSSDSANWSDPRALSLSWSSGVSYTRGAIVYYTNFSTYAWYICIQSGLSSTAPTTDTTMWAPVYYDTAVTPGIPGDTAVAGTKYYAGDYIYQSSNWWRCTTDHTFVNWGTNSGSWTSTNAIPYLPLMYRGLTTPSNLIIYYAGSTWYRYMGGWNVALTGNMHYWSSSSIKYNLGDAVYYSNGRWYRCILAHTSSGSIVPTNATYWATAPLHSTAWDSNRQYSQYDTVRYNGVWYLSLQNSNYGQNPATATTYWIGSNTSTASYQWSSTTAYSAGDYKCYGGVWYKCLTANTGQSPNNTTYWTAAWAQGSGVTTGAPVVYAEGTIAITGSPSITTQLRAPIAATPLFPNAVAATSTISANSGGTVDSYDSTSGTIAAQNGVANTTTPNLNYGTYDSHVNTATNYSAVVAAGSTTGTAITLSSTAVKGYVAAPSSSTSPYAPLFSSGGSVKGPISDPSPNIDLTRVSRSPSIPQFDTLPGGAGGLAANWATIPKGTPLSISYTTNLGAPGDTTPSRYYYNGNLTVGTGSLNVLRINGPVILFINGDLTITASGSTGRVDIANTGSAEIHLAGEFKADAGGEGILNYTSDPKKLIIISDTTNTSTHYYSEGVNDLYGVVYIPYSTSNTGFYNDNNSTEIFGAVSANKITYSGANLNVHYDTSLRYATFGGVDQPHTVSEWRELPVTEQATMP